MGKNKATTGKDKAHRKAQETKAWGKGFEMGIETAILASYMALSDHFKFSQDRINEFNYHFQKAVIYIMSETVSRDEIENTLLKQGIDIKQIGDDNIEKIEKLRDTVFAR